MSGACSLRLYHRWDETTDHEPPHTHTLQLSHLTRFRFPFRPQGREASVRREGLLHERTGALRSRAGKEEDGTARVRGQSASQV